MRTIVITIGLLIWVATISACWYAPKTVVAQQVKVQVQAGHGKVVERKSTELKRFSRPIDKPPTVHPPMHEGHAWRWHPHYGWIALPVALAPRAVVLEATYALPAQVTYYESAAVQVQAADGQQIVCPHCGQLITIQVAK